MKTSLDQSALTDASAALREANLAFAKAHPGESPGRQPVHTVYGGAQLFKSDSVPKLGSIALRTMEQYASKPAILASQSRIFGSTSRTGTATAPTPRKTIMPAASPESW